LKELKMSPVSLQREGSVSIITIDNPPVNALSNAVRAGIVECIDAAAADVTTHAIVLICAGRTFIAGADIREFNSPPQEPYLGDVVARIESQSKPVVAAIHGTALGGGLEVAMACHYRLADAAASVGLPEVNLGLLPGASGTQRVTRLAGVKTALDMMLSGKPMQANEALECGIIDEISESGNLRRDAKSYAEDMVPAGPRRVRDMSVDADYLGTFDEYRKHIAKKTRGLVSPNMIIRCVEMATLLPFDDACAVEREMFLEAKASPQSDGLRHAFFAERAVGKVPGISKETSTRKLETVAVLGAGTMGAGIAYNCLTAGYSVHLLDNSEEGLQRGRGTIQSLLDGGVKRGKMSHANRDDFMTRIEFVTDYADIANADLVIEAVFESMEVKQDVFAMLDFVCKPGAILATNTSTLDVDAIAAATTRPKDVIGLHFFSPAHIMRLLEIVRGEKTSVEVLATSLKLAKSLRKIGVVVGNCFGFVGNRMLYSYGRENQMMLLEGAAPEYIDKTLYNWGMAMGPNAVGDLAGLDVGYKVRQERTDLPDDPRFYRVANMLAEQERYGQKTGKGMYIYESDSRVPVPDPEVADMIRAEAVLLGVEQRKISKQEIIERCIYGLVSEGARVLEEGIASQSSDIDVVWTNGYGFPRHRGGPMHYADTVGLNKVLATINKFKDRFGAEYWEPPELLVELAKSKGTFGDYSRS
jgi:3-hydroxyacyl-CoA dehydrogenase